MNATTELIELVEGMALLAFDREDALPRVMRLIAAAKEEQAKAEPVACVLSIDEADEACAVGVQRWLQEEHGIDLDENAAERLSWSVSGEIEKAVREKCDNGYIAPSKEEQRRSPTWLGHCSGCKSPHSEGTHQMGTIEHPEIDNAKEEQGKVLTADEAERIAWMKHSDVVGSPNGVMASHAVWCMAYIRDNGYLAPASGLTVEGVLLTGEQPDPAGIMTVTLRLSDGREVEAIRTCANSIYHYVSVEGAAKEDPAPPDNTTP